MASVRRFQIINKFGRNFSVLSYQPLLPQYSAGIVIYNLKRSAVAMGLNWSTEIGP